MSIPYGDVAQRSWIVGHYSSCAPGSFCDRSQWVEVSIIITVRATRGDEDAVGFPKLGTHGVRLDIMTDSSSAT